MSHPPPYVPGQPAQFPPPAPQFGPTPPPRRKRGLLFALVGVAGILVLCIVGAVIVGTTQDGAKPKAGTTAKAADAALPKDPCGGGSCATTPDDTPTTTSTPKAADFVLTPQVTDKECFGSAGCNVTFRLKVDYAGTSSLDPDVTWLVVYEITGIDDSPQVGNFTVQGTNVNYDEQSVSTKSSKSKIKLKATSVQQN